VEFDPKSKGNNSVISPHSSDDPRISDIDDDITTAALGDGWAPPASDEIGIFRIATNGAVIGLPPRMDGTCVVSIDLEPIAASGTLVVRLVSTSGATLATSTLTGLRSMRIALPLRRSDIGTLRLVTEPGGAETRLRVRAIDITDLPGDVVVSPSIMRLGGHGWGEREFFGGEHFRWVDNDAEIHFLNDFRGSQMILDIAPGHSVLAEQMDLIVFDDLSQQLAVYGVAERSRIEVDLKPDTTGIRLHVVNGGAPVAGDPRILNMRVFAVRVTGA